MTGAVTAGNLLASGITAAMGAVVNVIGGVASAFAEVADLQSEAIGTAGDFSKMTGLSFEASTEQIDAFNDRMSVAAAALPGATKDYTALGRGIMDNLIPAFQDANGALNSVDFNATLDKITTAGALRAANAGIESKDAALAISKALSGKSISELSTLRFFEQSPAALASLEKEAAKIGLDLKSMTDRQRADVVAAALSVPDEVIEASKVSVNGLIEGFKSSLFDPNTGVFGLLRSLDDGNSVFSVAGETVTLIFGEDGFIAKAGELLEGLGLTSDPMESLADGLTWVNGWIRKLNESVGLMRNRMKAGVDIMAGFNPSELGSKAGQMLAKMYNRAIAALNNVDWLTVAMMVGKGIAAGINIFTNFIRNVDFTQVASLLLKVGIAASIAIGQAFIDIDWGSLGIVLLKVTAVAVLALGGIIAAAVMGMTAPAIATVAGLSVAIVATFGAVRRFWTSRGGSIMESVRIFFSGVENWLRSLLSQIPGVEVAPLRADVESGERSLANKASGLDQGGLFSAIRRERQAMPTGASIVVANDSEAILNAQQQRGLRGALANRGSSALNIGSLTINAGTMTDPEAIAAITMKAIERKWAEFNQQQLSPSY